MNEMALLFALFGAGIVVSARLNPDRQISQGRWDNPPTWVRVVARRGPGPISIMSLAFWIWGLGMMILGLAAGLALYDAVVVDFLLAS